MSPLMTGLRGLRDAVAVFDKLSIPYAVGGSFASALHGIGRHTNDVDLTVEPFLGKEERVVAAFGEDCYVSLDAIRDALRRRSSFNVINSSTGFKVDVFICKDEPFEKLALERRRPYTVEESSGPPIAFHTPEDIILFKLRWYRLGQEISDRQWSDILGVLKVQAGNLDESYLDRWAAELQVVDLLARAREESVI